MHKPAISVDQLLDMYQQYLTLSQEEATLSRQLARNKLRSSPDTELETQHTRLKQRLQSLSNEMTFDNPKIWMEYKFRAYRNDAQPISTMQDFRLHCSKPGYICTKRYTYLNSELAKRNMTPFSDTSLYPDSASLSKAIESDNILKLLGDEKFMTAWREYEYHMHDARVAKWENF